MVANGSNISQRSPWRVWLALVALLVLLAGEAIWHNHVEATDDPDCVACMWSHTFHADNESKAELGPGFMTFYALNAVFRPADLIQRFFISSRAPPFFL